MHNRYLTANHTINHYEIGGRTIVTCCHRLTNLKLVRSLYFRYSSGLKTSEVHPHAF